MNQHDLISSSANTDSTSSEKAIRVGLSACLAGELVRYNGGHTQSRLCINVLAEHFQFDTFCPEVAAGFGTPRPTLRLVGEPSAPKLVFSNSNRDVSAQLQQGFAPKLAAMASLDGYILMKNSPSCGLSRIKVYQANGHPHETRTAGLFTQALQAAYPLMPIEEEGRLHDPKLFDNFVLRVYAYHNFRHEVLARPASHALIRFHSSYKYMLMAHNQQQTRALGRQLATNKLPLPQLLDTYLESFMAILAKPASKGNHANALLHILGYLKTTVPSAARQHIAATIAKYQQGILPLTTPLTLLKHYLSQHGSDYIKAQRYLEPYPEDMNPTSKYYQ